MMAPLRRSGDGVVATAALVAVAVVVGCGGGAKSGATPAASGAASGTPPGTAAPARHDSTPPRDSAFGPKFMVDSTGKVVPIKRP